MYDRNERIDSIQNEQITFGMIVLNGEPFIKYNLRTIYPYAHQLIVVEGAAPSAECISTSKGHSRDGTLKALHEFKELEDPDNKLIIVTAEDEGYTDGFWPGEKHEQSQAYAKRVTGNYLWQIDIDEFYKANDIEKVLDYLIANPNITQMSFSQITFWGGFNYLVDGVYLRHGAEIYQRLFKWGSNYKYASHRPPTVLDDEGKDLRNLRYIDGKQMEKLGIYLYHYSLVFPKQVFDKCEYYSNAAWAGRSNAIEWAKHCYIQLEKPYRVHNVYSHYSWLERFSGTHPIEIQRLRNDIEENRLMIDTRSVDDIEKLLDNRKYAIGKAVLKIRLKIDIVRRIRRIKTGLKNVFNIHTNLYY